MMEVHEKRQLLDAIDILVKRPGACTEETLGTAMGYFKKLVEESTQNQIGVHYVINGEQND
ncbi:hypothetical protein P256_00028 [Acinetobacter nectaris CIP 110549]|uniref:Uncharacterized protein n=1 Tax=Acinetobacter nectaris CIP 110549 TaxID=1392540 RepID=V2TG81_9GAMM|nr:hypothetical protein [Acinetobacter nectaris]ESK41043.1 hypothetical protein P256_00028 [Acinetobacter nectaris CIP 110549]